MNGSKNSFHLPMNENTATVAMAGFDSGKTIESI